MSTTEERAAARKAAADALIDNVKRRRVEVLEELATANARYREEVADLLREGRELGLTMSAMQEAAGWKSRQSAYNALEATR